MTKQELTKLFEDAIRSKVFAKDGKNRDITVQNIDIAAHGLVTFAVAMGLPVSEDAKPANVEYFPRIGEPVYIIPRSDTHGVYARITAVSESKCVKVSSGLAWASHAEYRPATTEEIKQHFYDV